MYGHSGLPVLSTDRRHLRGWLTRHAVLTALAQTVATADHDTEQGAVAADVGAKDPVRLAHRSGTPLHHYEIVEIRVDPDSPLVGRRLADIAWPPGAVVVARSERGEMVTPRANTPVAVGERIVVLAPTHQARGAKHAPAAVGHSERTGGILGV
jgi:CIC family chloride channel protein